MRQTLIRYTTNCTPQTFGLRSGGPTVFVNKLVFCRLHLCLIQPKLGKYARFHLRLQFFVSQEGSREKSTNSICLDFTCLLAVSFQVAKLAGMLSKMGVGKGDRVLIYMPMVPEAVEAMLATVRLGAVHSVVFGGI